MNTSFFVRLSPIAFGGAVLLLASACNSLDPLSRRPLAVTGTVVSADGAAIAGTTVRVDMHELSCENPALTSAAVLMTDAAGRFEGALRVPFYGGVSTQSLCVLAVAPELPGAPADSVLDVRFGPEFQSPNPVAFEITARD